MKIKKSSHKLKLFSTIVSAAVVVGLVAGYFLLTKNTPTPAAGDTSGVNLDNPTDEQLKAGDAIKKQSVDKNTTTDGSKQQDQTSSQQASNTKLSTSITSSEVNGSTLYVRNEINGVYSTGTCVLKLTKGGTVITKTSGIQALAKISTCKGFDIPTSELSSGTWQIVLSVTINNQTATAQSTVTL